MRRHPVVARPTRAVRRPTAAILGPGHPLARAVEAHEGVVRQAVAVAAIVAVGIIGMVEGVAWAEAVAVSAAIVLLGLSVLAAAFEQRVRERARDLIAEGRDRVPLPAVQRECRHLRALRTRRVIASTLEAMILQAATPPPPLRGERPLFDAVVVTRVAADLREVSELLRADRAAVRGVAIVERLLTDGASPLYGHDAQALHDALRHVRELLRGEAL